MDRSILRGFLSIFGGRVGKLLLGLVSTPIVVRVLGDAHYGNYATMLSLLSIIWIIVNAGIFDGIRKYIAEDRDVRNWKTDVFVFYLQVGLVLAVTAALLVAAASYAGVVEAVFGPEFASYFYFLAGILVARQLWAVARGALMGFGFEEFSESIRLIRLTLVLCIGVPLAYLGFAVDGMLAGRLAATILIAIGGYLLVLRKIDPGSVTASVPSEFPRRELLSFNTLSVVLILLLSSLYHADVVLLQLLAGSAETGHYKAALVLAEFMWFGPGALQMVLLHSTSELWSNDRRERITELASRATRYSLLITLLLAIGLAALADAFVPLYYGESFAPAVTPLLLLLPGSIGFAVTRPILAIGQGEGSLRVLIYATGAAALLNLVLNVTLIPIYGTVGAAVATSIGYGSMVVLHVRSARTIGFDPVADLRLGRVALAAVPAALAIFGLSEAIGSDLLALAVVPPVGFLAFAGLSYATGAIDREEVDELVGYLPLRRVPFVSPE
ncbi:lipopolysaccharide biosynthesis protein [Halorussus halobius]|uniref:lipopolysaccharide biosynthesis protein n=1 Tax=Halorussus halobius TaxID=1710537 RepID=UPI001092D8F8|nr:polysaccharide biosynthesis C-terminal domain-containing protein [Halorussus halobius]